MKKYIIGIIPVIIAMAAFGIFLFTGLFMLLWNSILPAVLHVGAITIWQAAGILLLSRIIFGGFRNRRKIWHRRRYDMEWRHIHTRNEKTFNCHSSRKA